MQLSRVVRQIDQGNPQPAQKFKPVAFFCGWASGGVGRGGGSVLRGGLLWVAAGAPDAKMGVKVYVIAPQNWDKQGQRQVNDKHDAQVIYRGLGEYQAG
jgi:hypothetical protein